jgi:7,8-dihydropterin-6-yl-methyl-4-(beta-D-ribofuranosyl)aminobenzene 5'-phosphate synthase
VSKWKGFLEEEIMSQIIKPETVDQASISIIMDNSIDLLLANTDVAKRFAVGANPFEKLLPIAEHGFSVLIRTKLGEKEGEVLFDAGNSKRGIQHNLGALEISLSDVQAIVLSHGHGDHVMGLPGFVDHLGPHNIPLVLHPDASLDRKLILPNGDEMQAPAPRLADLSGENIEIVEEVGPSMLVDEMVLVSGEVERTTEFETGFPIHYAKRQDQWEPDPLIMDDQCALIHVKGKGLIVITGCGHSGIINTIRYAQVITGIQEIYAVIGGFHLTGGYFEPIIPATIAELKAINPRYVMPGHCTGWSATHQIARAMPEAYIPNSVGTTLIF